MKEKIMLDKFINFVKQAGQYSLEVRNNNHNINFKDKDASISSMVTEVDIRNSSAFKEFIEQNFSDLNYIIIEEESMSDMQDDLFAKVAQSEYQFIFDPIDGTINYSVGLPFYGILAAVFKNGKPLYGIVYAPVLDELVYTDGKEIFYEHNGQKQTVSPFSQSKSCVIQGNIRSIKLNPAHFNKRFLIEDYFAAAICYLYLPLGNLKAVIGGGKIWDVAPMMAFAKVLGMKFLDYYTAEEVTELSPRFFKNDGDIKTLNIICFPEEYEEIKSVILSLDEQK